MLLYYVIMYYIIYYVMLCQENRQQLGAGVDGALDDAREAHPLPLLGPHRPRLRLHHTQPCPHRII